MITMNYTTTSMQNQVTSQELSQQLYDRGYSGKTLFVWVNDKVKVNDGGWAIGNGFVFPAPTLNELLEVLPSNYTIIGNDEVFIGHKLESFIKSKDLKVESVGYTATVIEGKNQNACAKLLITLVDEGVVKF